MIPAGIDVWVFDLDNTLYPSSDLYDEIGVRMTRYIARTLGVDETEALRLREAYFHEYGATAVGLRHHHGVDPLEFMADVHDVDPRVVDPDPELEALIARLPGRKIVFTNGGGGHAERIVAQIGIAHHFEHLFDLETAGLVPKPVIGAYQQLIDMYGVDPKTAVMVEDTLRNLEPAHQLGFTTVLIGPVHPEPKPAYVDHWARDLKEFLRQWLND